MTKDAPVYIMPENTQRSTGRSAQRNNILAARLVGETVRTTLGPKGMDKLLMDAMGDITVTNDGVTILREMEIEHPIARMVVEIAKTQETEVGDGTTTVVVLAAELLKRAEELLDQDVHPTIIINGYRKAQEKALTILENIAENITEKDLVRIAETAMTGKGSESHKQKLAVLVARAVKSVADKEKIDLDDIKIERATGNIEQTELIEGIVLDKEKLHPEMPPTVSAAKIALIDMPIEIKSTEIDAKIQISNPAQMQEFLDMEEQMLRSMVGKIKAAGANVVLCQKGIDDLAQHFLAKEGIYAVRRVKKSDMERLAKVTGAKIITTLEDLHTSDLGKGTVAEKRFGDNDMTYVSSPKASAVTILVKGSTEHISAEIERALEDALGVVASALRTKKGVGGAAATEVELARNLTHYANTLSGREQLAVKAYASSMLSIPRTLAENAGLDPIDTIADLRAHHEKGSKWAGIDVFTGKVIDAFKEGIVEPLQIKTQAVRAATDVAITILRIDDVIAVGKQEAPDMPSMD